MQEMSRCCGMGWDGEVRVGGGRHSQQSSTDGTRRDIQRQALSRAPSTVSSTRSYAPSFSTPASAPVHTCPQPRQRPPSHHLHAPTRSRRPASCPHGSRHPDDTHGARGLDQLHLPPPAWNPLPFLLTAGSSESERCQRAVPAHGAGEEGGMGWDGRGRTVDLHRFDCGCRCDFHLVCLHRGRLGRSGGAGRVNEMLR